LLTLVQPAEAEALLDIVALHQQILPLQTIAVAEAEADLVQVITVQHTELVVVAVLAHVECVVMLQVQQVAATVLTQVTHTKQAVEAKAAQAVPVASQANHGQTEIKTVIVAAVASAAVVAEAAPVMQAAGVDLA
tara:strand:+ start:59 stop:463 length:405 start_codon:yes stop_codon:yes gene_type:complete